jgi:hypothetical protein
MGHITTWEEDYKGNNTSPSLQSPLANSSSPSCICLILVYLTVGLSRGSCILIGGSVISAYLRHKTQQRSAKFGVGTLRCQTISDCFSEWPGDQGVDSLQGHHIQTISWVHTASSAGSTGGWFPWPLASSGAYVMNTCSCTSTPPYISWYGT